MVLWQDITGSTRRYSWHDYYEILDFYSIKVFPQWGWSFWQSHLHVLFLPSVAPSLHISLPAPIATFPCPSTFPFIHSVPHPSTLLCFLCECSSLTLVSQWFLNRYLARDSMWLGCQIDFFAKLFLISFYSFFWYLPIREPLGILRRSILCILTVMNEVLDKLLTSCSIWYLFWCLCCREMRQVPIPLPVFLHGLKVYVTEQD